ncbi:MAG TPA: hypothetical protein DEP69_02305, partial [Acidimicrobiaceae bacterium]|nr:hypothetical protein [Acidimicrobiaceae bacterium]
MPHGEALTRLADAVHAREPDELAAAKAAVVDAAGAAVMVDAVAVAANFSMMTRIADGTGTPLDAGTAEMSRDARAAVG